jgi:hypothetical protein
MAINNTALTTTAQSIYTSSGSSAITTIHLCNYTNTAVTANVYAVPSGGTPNASTILYSNVAITAYNTLIIYQEKLILSNGDQIDANCSVGGAVTATVSSIGI